MGKWLPEVAARPEGELRMYETYDAIYGLPDSWQRTTAAAFAGHKARAVPDSALADMPRGMQTAKQGWAVVKSSIMAARRRSAARG